MCATEPNVKIYPEVRTARACKALESGFKRDDG